MRLSSLWDPREWDLKAHSFKTSKQKKMNMHLSGMISREFCYCIGWNPWDPKEVSSNSMLYQHFHHNREWAYFIRLLQILPINGGISLWDNTTPYLGNPQLWTPIDRFAASNSYNSITPLKQTALQHCGRMFGGSRAISNFKSIRKENIKYKLS